MNKLIVAVVVLLCIGCVRLRDKPIAESEIVLNGSNTSLVCGRYSVPKYKHMEIISPDQNFWNAICGGYPLVDYEANETAVVNISVDEKMRISLDCGGKILTKEYDYRIIDGEILIEHGDFKTILVCSVSTHMAIGIRKCKDGSLTIRKDGYGYLWITIIPVGARMFDPNSSVVLKIDPNQSVNSSP